MSSNRGAVIELLREAFISEIEFGDHAPSIEADVIHAFDRACVKVLVGSHKANHSAAKPKAERSEAMKKAWKTRKAKKAQETPVESEFA